MAGLVGCICFILFLYLVREQYLGYLEGKKYEIAAEFLFILAFISFSLFIVATMKVDRYEERQQELEECIKEDKINQIYFQYNKETVYDEEMEENKERIEELTKQLEDEYSCYKFCKKLTF